jgi:hypothetical protein
MFQAGRPGLRRDADVCGYTVYTGSGTDTAAQAATEWFTEHLVNAKAVAP